MIRAETITAAPADTLVILAEGLCRHLSRLGNVPFSDLWQGIANIDPDWLPLLNGPQGWVALGQMLTGDDDGGDPFSPTVH